MQNHEMVLVSLGILLALVVLALAVKAVLWVGRDARKRGFERVWLLQLLTVIEFPWPWLMYYLVTRHLDREAPNGLSESQRVVAPRP
ncbi:MAG: hypothetical protein JRI68_15295 [Deltaproteobacteria bacterium]|nr:hypothetical protein [Deltaproteobacteria bacterium]